MARAIPFDLACNSHHQRKSSKWKTRSITTAVSQRGFHHLYFSSGETHSHLRVITWIFPQAATNAKVQHFKRGADSHSQQSPEMWCTRFTPKDKPVCVMSWQFGNSISAAVQTFFCFFASYEILMSSVWWSESTQTLLLCNGPPLCLLLHLCHPLTSPPPA